VPPQSWSVSLPFGTPSLQVGRAQVPSVPASAPVQTLFLQSAPTLHPRWSPQAGQVAPPQSTSVSSESLTPSVQCALTQLPLPSQTSPVPPSTPMQLVPWGAWAVLHVCAAVSQLGVAHVVAAPQLASALHLTQ
jgi:hypothetical protein